MINPFFLTLIGLSDDLARNADILSAEQKMLKAVTIILYGLLIVPNICQPIGNSTNAKLMRRPIVQKPPDLLTAEEQKELAAVVELQIDTWIEDKHIHEVTDETEDE